MIRDWLKMEQMYVWCERMVEITQYKDMYECWIIQVLKG